MQNILAILQVIVPIFVVIGLGVLARKKQMMKPEEIQGLQNFVVKFALPCVVFNSCVTAEIGTESLTTMVLAFLMVLCGTLWAFRFGRKMFAYHNFPMLFAAQETGMLGIPLFLILFGAGEVYRMGVLDMIQAAVGFPVIAILSADAGENPHPAEIAKKVCSSPLLIMAVLGLAMNFSGLADTLNNAGVLGILTESTGFLTQPISVLMIFSVGYNFSLAKESRRPVLELAGLHFGLFTLFSAGMQLVLCLIPNVDIMTRCAAALYCALPASYLSPGLGKGKEDYTVASGVCSLTTATCLLVFCGMAAFVR